MEPMGEIHEASTYHLAGIWPFPMSGSGEGLYQFESADAAAESDREEGKRRGSPEGDDPGKGDCNGKRAKAKMEAEVGEKGGPPERTKQDYIHVRARRGQATDSHSLAERARREKISERMKILQELVPGCNKVVGKALVLDEIINYIQSLQRQVEFLSMKLEAVTSRMNPSMEGFPSKNFEQHTFDAAFGPQAAREYGRGSSPEWLHMQIGSGFERA